MECDFLEKIKKLDFFIKCARLSVLREYKKVYDFFLLLLTVLNWSISTINTGNIVW